MQFTLSNNPIDKLVCWFYNTKEDISPVYWINGKQKKAECRICGDVLDSWKDKYSPMQCGWHKIGNRSHRIFTVEHACKRWIHLCGLVNNC